MPTTTTPAQLPQAPIVQQQQQKQTAPLLIIDEADDIPLTLASEVAVPNIPSAQQVSKSTSNDEPATSKALKCIICQEVMQSPFAARCGHIACQACWDSWLPLKLECPVCRVRVRQKQLTKLFI